MRQKGFTLIELLVVIAIITALAAIMFPVLAQARKKVEAVSCISNLKQIATGFLMYIQDYDGRFTPYECWGCFDPGHGSDATDPCRRWFVRVFPYVKGHRVFACTSGNICKANRWGQNPGCAWRWVVPPDWYGKEIGYGINPRLTEGNGMRWSVLPRPAEVMMVADSSHKEACYGSMFWAGTCKANRCGFELRTEENTRHQGGTNIGFADGHVKWIKVPSGSNLPEYPGEIDLCRQLHGIDQ